MNKLLKYALIAGAAYYGYKMYKDMQAKAVAMKARAELPLETAALVQGQGPVAGDWDHDENVYSNPWATYHFPRTH